MKLALIDVDGTLLPDTRSEPRFILELARHGALGPRQLGAFLLFALRWAPRFGRHVWKKDKAYLAGLPTGEVEARARAFVEETLLGRVSPVIAERIAAHRRDGDALALLTGTPQFIAAPLAESLGIAHVRATRCTRRNGRFTADPPETHPFGAEKIATADLLRRMLGLQWRDCLAYGDSIHDRPLLERVGRPVAVTPDRPLTGLARARGWEILA